MYEFEIKFPPFEQEQNNWLYLELRSPHRDGSVWKQLVQTVSLPTFSTSDSLNKTSLLRLDLKEHMHIGN